MLARRSSVLVNYQGVDISNEIQNDLLSFSYADNASGEADSINLTLKDEKKKWLKNWFPEKGDVITPQIKTLNWRKNGDKQTLPCGRFYVDQPSYEGRPSIITLGAISSPLNSNFSNTDRSRVWRNISLKAIATDIAKRAGLQLQFIGENNPIFSTKEQTETSDSSFLFELCEEEGLAMKVTDSKIVIFDEIEFEKRESVTEYKEWSDNVISYGFQSTLTKTGYAGVNVKYFDPLIGQMIEYLFSIGDFDKEKDKIYQLNKKVKSREEARRLAQKTLRKLNKKQVTGSLTVLGNVDLLGGSCIDIDGFGAFDGKYFITSALHELPKYTTTIQIRKVLEGY